MSQTTRAVPQPGLRQPGPRYYLPPAAPAGTTFPQNVTATAVVVTATAVRQVGKLVTASAVVVTASMARQAAKALTATVVATTTITRRAGKFVTATATGTATSVQTFISGGGVTTPQAMTATSVTVTATLTATFVPAPVITGVSVQDFAPLVAA